MRFFLSHFTFVFKKGKSKEVSIYKPLQFQGLHHGYLLTSNYTMSSDESFACMFDEIQGGQPYLVSLHQTTYFGSLGYPSYQLWQCFIVKLVCTQHCFAQGGISGLLSEYQTTRPLHHSNFCVYWTLKILCVFKVVKMICIHALFIHHGVNDWQSRPGSWGFRATLLNTPPPPQLVFSWLVCNEHVTNLIMLQQQQQQNQIELTS